MNLLETPLPQLSVTIDVDASVYFDRCEAIAQRKGWKPDRRRPGVGRNFDQLNLHLGKATTNEYPIVRMVEFEQGSRRLEVDVSTLWSSHPVDYDEYLRVARECHAAVNEEYQRAHRKSFRLGVPRRPKVLDLTQLDCSKIDYAAEKLLCLTKSLAVAPGDARQRLLSAYHAFHVIRPTDLPPPLDDHLAWVYSQITKREPRHPNEGRVQASVARMKNTSAAKVLERIVDLVEAISALHAHCNKRRSAV